MSKLNTFFRGTVDELLEQTTANPTKEIEKINSPDEVLHRQEIIDTIIDDFKLGKDEATKIADELLLEEYYKIMQGLADKGYVEVISYDKDFKPEYGLTEQGNKLRTQNEKKEESHKIHLN